MKKVALLLIDIQNDYFVGGLNPLVKSEEAVRNARLETPLMVELQEKSIISLVICGMMTLMCVDSTVRAARDFGFNCTVIGDACAP